MLAVFRRALGRDPLDGSGTPHDSFHRFDNFREGSKEIFLRETDGLNDLIALAPRLSAQENTIVESPMNREHISVVRVEWARPLPPTGRYRPAAAPFSKTRWRHCQILSTAQYLRLFSGCA